MGYFVGIPLGGAAEKDCQVRFGKNMTFQVETRAPHLPAEWALQSGVQLTWPHADTDWAYMLEEVQQCFIAIASEIAKRELLLIVTPEPEEVRKQISATARMTERINRYGNGDGIFAEAADTAGVEGAASGQCTDCSHQDEEG